MKLWPQSLAFRLLLAGLLGVAGVAALAFFVSEHESVAAGLRPPPAAPPPPARVVVAVPGVRGKILLTSRADVVPAAAGLVVQLLADGNEVLRRPPPLPDGPNAARELDRDAVIVLPHTDLSQFGAVARGGLVELIGRLVTARPVRAERFVTLDFHMPLADLQRLLAWVP